jgi:hypothetical protein
VNGCSEKVSFADSWKATLHFGRSEDPAVELHVIGAVPVDGADRVAVATEVIESVQHFVDRVLSQQYPDVAW